MKDAVIELLERVDTSDLWECLDSDDPTEALIFRLQETLKVYLEKNDDLLSDLAVTEYEERTHHEHLINEDLVDLKRANGWAA